MIRKPGKTEVLLFTGIATGGWCLYEIVRYYKIKRQDLLASLLLEELTKLLNPATSGLLSEEAFSIHYKQKVLATVRGSVLTLQPSVAARYAEQVYNSFGNWISGGDDEQKVYAVFTQLKDKVQVSQVATAFLDQYGRSLIDKLHEKFDSGEISKILTIVSTKPPYRIRK
ncbi:MAG: hypothetical protein WBA74_17460 [Cyclobacteriaceae bacterium]